MKQCRECGVICNDDTVFCYICGSKFTNNSEKMIETDASKNEINTKRSLKNNNNEESNISCLKTNGVYYLILSNFRHIIRFLPDGSVMGESDLNTVVPSVTELQSISYNEQGKYFVKSVNLSFSLENEDGLMDYWGRISNDALFLKSCPRINRYQSSYKEYKYIEL